MTIKKKSNGFHGERWADVRQSEKQNNREMVRGGEDQEQDRESKVSWGSLPDRRSLILGDVALH